MTNIKDPIELKKFLNSSLNEEFKGYLSENAEVLDEAVGDKSIEKALQKLFNTKFKFIRASKIISNAKVYQGNPPIPPQFLDLFDNMIMEVHVLHKNDVNSGYTMKFPAVVYIKYSYEHSDGGRNGYSNRNSYYAMFKNEFVATDEETLFKKYSVPV